MSRYVLDDKNNHEDKLFNVALLRSIRDNKDYDIRVNNHPLRK